MGKLFNLKEWLTVREAAQHLSIVFGEEVSKADVLQLALEGHLKLSVNFVNHAYARRGKIVCISETDFLAAIKAGNLPDELRRRTVSVEIMRPDTGVPDERKKAATYLRSLKLYNDRYLSLSSDVTSITGIWDLPMLGGEGLAVEHAYQMMTGGPKITIQHVLGSFVERSGVEMCQLQESFDDNEYQSGSNAQLEKLKQHIAENNIEVDEAERLLQQHKEKRKEFLERKKARPASENYYPAGGLPKDSVLVVRTGALREFEQSINGAQSVAEKPMTPNERNSLLTIIAALCDHSAIGLKERGAAGRIAKLTEGIGAVVSDDAVRRALAKIPDALESRMK